MSPNGICAPEAQQSTMLEINSSRSNILNNGRPEEAEFDEDDEEYYRALKNVFVEPRHEEIGEEIKNLPAQNWRSKDKVCELFSQISILILTKTHFFSTEKKR